MPILVIHQLGRPPRRETAVGSVVRVGRDAKNDVILQGATVSRAHLTLEANAQGGWTATCVSDKNPIVVDGALVSGAAQIAEGSEILVGKEHLLVFAESGITAVSYMGSTSYFAKSTCDRCGWTGVVSTLRREPVCPKCGGTRLTAEAGTQARGDQTTAKLTAPEARAEFARIRAAKRTALERVEKGDKQGDRFDLAEDRPLVLGGDGPSVELRGLTLGSVKIGWKGDHFFAESAMKFPALRVNGVKVESSKVRHGDLLEIGSNRFRVVTH